MALMTSTSQHPAPVTTSYIRKTQKTSEQPAQDGGAAFGALGKLLKKDDVQLRKEAEVLKFKFCHNEMFPK